MTEKPITHILQGHVKHQGLPVAGVAVQVFSQYSAPAQGIGKGDPPIQEVVTGSKGEFSFSLLPGGYIVEVIPSTRTRFLKERIADVELNGNTICNVSLTTGTLLTGSVTTYDGQRLADVEVVAIGIEPSSYSTSSAVDADGTYTLVVPKGKFQVAPRHFVNQALKKEEETESENGFLSFPFVSTQVQVVNLVVDGTVDLILPELVKFQGEIRDVFGQPVARATVKFFPTLHSDQIVVRELNLCADCVSDAAGRFEIYLEPGSYDLEIVPAASATHFGMKENNIKITADTFRKFILEEGHKLRGEVLYEDVPLESCLVRVQDVGGAKEFIAKTDNYGQFTLGVPGGNYKMVVVAHPKNAPTVTIDGAEHTGIAPWAKIIVVGGDTHVSVGLRSGTALRGRVKDDSGQARAGMQVSVFADTKEKVTAETADWNLALAHSVTDAEGRYSIFLSPGNYFIVVHKDFENATPITVGTDPVNLDIIWHGWCQLKFEVIGEDGAKVPRCQMEYYPYGEKSDDEDDDNLPRGYVLTDEEGRCQVTIPQGVYTFRFNPPNSGSYDPKDIRQLSISSDINRKVVLTLKKTV